MRITTPIPQQMRHLPLDQRGYPIFFGAYIDSDGTPHFTVNDDRKRALMIAHDLCSICGKKLFRGRWFCGGPASALHERGCYIDMPMHGDCIHFALTVCPYLAAPSWSREIATKKAAQVKDAVVLQDPTMIPGRPTLFVVVMAVGQELLEGGAYVKPKRPYRQIEYWLHGKRLADDVGAALSATHMERIEETA
jgi:hypothetical protein